MKQRGFTLIETMIAIFILTLTVGGLLELAAGGYFSVRYERNQIVADNLLQESLEYVRNSRDTALQQGSTWQAWLAGYTSAAAGCTTGCIIDPFATTNNVRPPSPSSGEFITFYPSIGLYGYADSQYPPLGNPTAAPYATTYKLLITVQPIVITGGNTTPDQAIVKGTITWSNGSSTKTATQSILVTNWQLQS
jgi:prepilin-type N-terminal cleavage/methylation domain-containing protein